MQERASGAKPLRTFSVTTPVKLSENMGSVLSDVFAMAVTRANMIGTNPTAIPISMHLKGPGHVTVKKRFVRDSLHV